MDSMALDFMLAHPEAIKPEGVDILPDMTCWPHLLTSRTVYHNAGHLRAAFRGGARMIDAHTMDGVTVHDVRAAGCAVALYVGLPPGSLVAWLLVDDEAVSGDDVRASEAARIRETLVNMLVTLNGMHTSYHGMLGGVSGCQFCGPIEDARRQLSISTEGADILARAKRW